LNGQPKTPYVVSCFFNGLPGLKPDCACQLAAVHQRAADRTAPAPARKICAAPGVLSSNCATAAIVYLENGGFSALARSVQLQNPPLMAGTAMSCRNETK